MIFYRIFLFFTFIILGITCESTKSISLLRGSNKVEASIPLVPNNTPDSNVLNSYLGNLHKFFDNVGNYMTMVVAINIFSAICFVFCLRGLSSPETAKRGNFVGIIGMLGAISITFLQPGFSFQWLMFFVPFLIASAIGIVIAHFVSMVHLPQLVAIFHSFVGLAAMLVAYSDLWSPYTIEEAKYGVVHYIEMYIGEFIASVTFTGSIVAAGKLHEIFPSNPLKIPGKHILNLLIISGIITMGVLFVVFNDFALRTYFLYGNSLASMLLGVHLVSSIGGADMPVVISMLNSYSGWATSFTGFMLNSPILIIAGALIGSSGAILSYVMCCGMNRSFVNVIFGGWDDLTTSSSLDSNKYDLSSVQEINSVEVVMELFKSKSILIVPGYGMAVSRSQSEVAGISELLRARGVKVEFAVHPVAGRMPGHMNVLLAEAEVPYKIVKELEEVNPHIEDYDVVLVIGANDTVNPISLEKGSKTYGMPVIEVWRAKKVIVCKRSLGRGYAEIDNPLFFNSNTRMLFGNAKDKMSEVQSNIRIYSSEMSMPVNNVTETDYEDSLDNGTNEDSTTDKTKDLDNSYPNPSMTIGILKEVDKNENLVAMVPNYVRKLRKMGYRILFESGAGVRSKLLDDLYEKAGCIIMDNKNDLITRSDILIKVQKPTLEEVELMHDGQVLISLIWPAQNPDLMNSLADKGVIVVALDEVPRTTRAQSVDIRSSMSNLSGYRAIIEAFSYLPKLSKTSITAAGKVDAAKVFVIGAGVAGLQAIATAHNLGARVFVNDARTATKEEVESLGGKFLAVSVKEDGAGAGGYAKETTDEFTRAQRELFTKVLRGVDIVICTASIPGKLSPKLITKEMVAQMKPGSVIVDMAAEMGDVKIGWGGNCELTRKNQVYEDSKSQVTIIGYTNLPSTMPTQASELFSMNLLNLLNEFGEADKFNIDLDNDLLNSMVVVSDNKIRYIPFDQRPVVSNTKTDLEPAPSIADINSVVHESWTYKLANSDISFFTLVVILLGIAIGFGFGLDFSTLNNVLAFVLSVFIGYYCVWSVSPSLHTPLMSVTNALSGIIIIGAMLECGPVSLFTQFSTFSLFVFLSILFSSINIVGGFYITARMLSMFNSNIETNYTLLN